MKPALSLRRLLAAVCVACLACLGAACSNDDRDDPAKRKHPLAPQFSADTGEDGGATTVAGGSGSATTARGQGATTTVAGGSGASTTVAGGSPTTVAGGGPGSTAPTSASITDKPNDTTPSLLGAPPSWSDLIGARLTRSPSGFELRVGLRGGAPERTPDEDTTMNVAMFSDVDGDGTIDYEVWANVASGGWGSSYFNNQEGGGAGFGDDSGVTVTVEGGELVLRFPLSHLGDAERFRWALGSEWGRYETIGTAAAVRDDAPDNDAAARFPSA